MSKELVCQNNDPNHVVHSLSADAVRAALRGIMSVDTAVGVVRHTYEGYAPQDNSVPVGDVATDEVSVHPAILASTSPNRMIDLRDVSESAEAAGVLVPDPTRFMDFDGREPDFAEVRSKDW